MGHEEYKDLDCIHDSLYSNSHNINHKQNCTEGKKWNAQFAEDQAEVKNTA